MLAITRHLPINGVLVDIGTGSGIAPRFAMALGAQVITLDSYASAGASAIENARAAGMTGHFCDVEREPFPIESGVADCVFFGDVIEHLHNSPRPVLYEILRVLKPNGVCICVTPNAVRLTVRLKLLMGLSNWADIHEFLDEKMHFGHHHEYTVDDLKFVFKNAGFDLCEFVLHESNLREVKLSSMRELGTQNRSRTQSRQEPLLISIAKYLPLFLTYMFPRLRSSMLIVARKPTR